MNTSQSRIAQVVNEVSKASIGKIKLKDFMDDVVAIGSRKLRAKSCSIFLLIDDEGTLEIVVGFGKIGRELELAKAKYYVPRRDPLLRKPAKRVKFNSWTEEKKLIKDKRLGMGITAFVVKTGKPYCGKARDFENHPEHRGKYEKQQREDCKAILEIPLYLRSHTDRKPRAKADGVIKVENPRNKNQFDENDKFVLSILATCVSNVIQRMEAEDRKSYKRLFNGARLLTELLRWSEQNRKKIKPKDEYTRINERISEFSIKTLKYNIYGIKEIYEEVIIVIKYINKILGFKEDWIKTIGEISVKFEEILGEGLRYREHFIHQFQVFLLGLLLLNRNKTLRKLLENYLQRNQITGNLKNVIRCWFLSSVFHDSVYSIEKINEWLGAYFRTLFSSELVDGKIPFIFLWENLFTVEKYEYHKNLLAKSMEEKIGTGFGAVESAKLYQFFISTLMGRPEGKAKNHGLLAALVMSSHLLGENPSDQDIRKIILESAFAVAMHTLNVAKNIYDIKRVKLNNIRNDIPFAFLLVFCDNAQEWGRPWMGSLTPGTVELKKIRIEDNEVLVELLCDVSDPKLDIQALKEIVGGVQENWFTQLKDISFHISYKDKNREEIAGF